MFTMRFSSFVRETRYAAVQQGKELDISLDLDENEISRPAPSPTSAKEGASPARQVFSLPAGFRLLDVWTGDTGRSLNSGNVLLPFSPKGYAERAILHFEDQQGKRFSIEIAKFSGDISLSEGYLSPPGS